MRPLAIALALALALLAPIGARASVYDDYKKLTTAEKWLCLRYFWQIGRVKDAADYALARCASTYPTLSPDDNQRDAHRHSTWNAVMTASLDGKDAAKRWADAHEDWSPNPAARKAMDLTNNATGRDVAAATRSQSGPWWNRSVSYASNDALADTLKGYVETGRLVMIEEVNGARDPDHGRLVPTTRP